jgi:hypothetical protein
MILENIDVAKKVFAGKVLEELENIIEIKNLYKSYGDVKAVSNLSFNVKKLTLRLQVVVHKQSLKLDLRLNQYHLASF